MLKVPCENFQVVFEDALDLEEAADICYNAIFGNHGQNCCAGTAIDLPNAVYF